MIFKYSAVIVLTDPGAFFLSTSVFSFIANVVSKGNLMEQLAIIGQMLHKAAL